VEAGGERQIVQLGGRDEGLVARLGDSVREALAGGHAFYTVNIEPVGRVGEVLVSIDGAEGHLPLLFRPEEVEKGFIYSVVKSSLREREVKRALTTA
jgi:hypothetical protein